MSKRLCFAVVLTAVVVFAGVTAVMAVPHPAVNMLDANGVVVTSTTPYSPLNSCGKTGVCHPGGVQTTGGHNYGSDPTSVTHTQGSLESDGRVYWQSYLVHFFDHGVSKGRHTNHGRNEAYDTEMRTVFGDPFFTSSPGMFGKY